MTEGQRLDVDEVLSTAGITRFQYATVALIFTVVAVEGFDAVSIGFVGPAILKEFKLSMSGLGPIASASLFGLLLGSLAIGIFADKYGRKRSLILSMSIATVFSFACIHATTGYELGLWRFLTGVGLGGGIPTAYTMVSDFLPERRRSAAVMIVALATAVGSSIGAFLASESIAIFGWRSVFALGGLLSGLMVAVIAIWLHESPRWLALNQGAGLRIRRVMARIAPGLPETSVFCLRDAPVKGITVGRLFQEGRAIPTLLIWITYFMGFFDMYLLSAWLPTLMASAGATERASVLSVALYQIGGFAGGLLLCRLVSRTKSRGIAFSFFACLPFVIATALLSKDVYFAIAAVTGVGFFLIASVTGVSGFASAFYPTSIRATGMGWGMGIGRLGSMVGPLIVGALVAAGWNNQQIFMACAVPAALAGFAMLIFPQEDAFVVAKLDEAVEA